MAQHSSWPDLDAAACRDTMTTLHLMTQVIGKVQLALTPSQAEWAQAPLHLTARGLESQLLWPDDRGLSLGLDLVAHDLRLESTTGQRRVVPLAPGPIAGFYAAVLGALAELDVQVVLEPTSVETRTPVALSTDDSPRGYEPRCAFALHQAWTRAAAVFDRYRSGFRGKQTPVSLWWGTFDLSVTRFSGRPASPPYDSGRIERAAMGAEQSLVGFWPGDETSPAPVFFAYTYPKPPGLETAAVSPPGAGWSDDVGEFVLPYETVRTAADPAARLLDFCESAYAAGARLAGWDRAGLERRPSAPRAA